MPPDVIPALTLDCPTILSDDTDASNRIHGVTPEISGQSGIAYTPEVDLTEWSSTIPIFPAHEPESLALDLATRASEYALSGVQEGRLGLGVSGSTAEPGKPV